MFPRPTKRKQDPKDIIASHNGREFFSMSEGAYDGGEYWLLQTYGFNVYFDKSTLDFIGAEQLTTGEWIYYGRNDLGYFREYNERIYRSALSDLRYYLHERGVL